MHGPVLRWTQTQPSGATPQVPCSSAKSLEVIMKVIIHLFSFVSSSQSPQRVHYKPITRSSIAGFAYFPLRGEKKGIFFPPAIFVKCIMIDLKRFFPACPWQVFKSHPYPSDRCQLRVISSRRSWTCLHAFMLNTQFTLRPNMEDKYYCAHAEANKNSE